MLKSKIGLCSLPNNMFRKVKTDYFTLCDECDKTVYHQIEGGYTLDKLCNQCLKNLGEVINDLLYKDAIR